MDLQAERKFLHDIATPMTVCKLVIARLELEISALSIDASEVEKIKVRLQKLCDCLKKMEDLHATHRAFIHTQIKDSA